MSSFKVILIFIIAAALGIVFISELSIDLLPNTSLPVLTVSYSLQDSPPEIIEQQATGPLENALSQISQVRKMYSVSGNEQGIIEMTFDQEADIAFKKFEVNSIIRHVYRKLNNEISYPIVEQRSRENANKSPLLIYQINARLAPFQIRKATEDILVPTISQKEGVYEVPIRGAEEIQLTIAYNDLLLKQFEISSQDIVKQLQNEFKTFYPGALLTSGTQRYTIKGGRPPENLKDIEDIMIRSSSGNYFPLKKVAQVFWEESKPRQYFRINSLNSITLTIFADEGVNRFALAEELKITMKNLEARMPQGFDIVEDYDDTEFLKREIDKNLFRSALSFGILFVFLLVSYRNLKHLLILFSGILISLGLTAFISYLINIQIHLYTIAGLTISLGIIVDNSIVVIDHIKIKRDKKIIMAVMGASFTTIMALMLVLFLPEEERQSLTEFCIIVSVSIACSVATALFYTPAMNATFFSTQRIKRFPFRDIRKRVLWFTRYNRAIIFIASYRKTFIITCILIFGIPLFLLPPHWEGREWYNKSIGSATYQKTIRPYTDAVLGGALRLFINNVYDRSGYREAKRTQLYVEAELPQGNTIEDMNKVIWGMETYLATVDGIEKYITQINSGQHASIVITFERNSGSSSLPIMVKGSLIAHSLNWGGVQWRIYGVGQGFTNSSVDNLPTFNVEMRGYNYDQLELYAESFANKLLTNNRIQKINTNERLNINEKSTEHLVLNFGQILPQGGTAMTSQLTEKTEHAFPSTSINLNDQLYQVYLQPANKILSTYDVMETALVMSDSQQFKLSSIATMRKEITSNAIHKQDRQYIRNVGFEYIGNHQFGREFLKTKIAEMQSEMRPGYSIKTDSGIWSWEEAKRQYLIVIILIVGIYFIASILFENLNQPFFIVLTIPLSFIGVFLGFSLFDFYFDQGGYAAMIMLGGLVVNASIYIINDLNNSINKHNNRAVLKAVIGKVRPILLTVISTCLGLLPFMIGGQNEVFWFSLAVGTTGGLLFSLFVVFFCLPVFLTKRLG